MPRDARPDDDHSRWSELAVGHALGGLDQADGTKFRAHLTDCSACRQHVAELRQISTDLESAERDEKARSRAAVAQLNATAVADEEEQHARARRHATTMRWAIIMLSAFSLAATAGLLSMRTATTAAMTSASRANDAVEALAEADAADLEILADGIAGGVFVTDTQVHVNLAGLPVPHEDTFLAVWWLDDAGFPVLTPALFTTDSVVDGHVYVAEDRETVYSVMVTIEDRPRPVAPRGEPLVRAILPA